MVSDATSHNAKLIEDAVTLAMRCVADGEVLMPFVITEGGKGSINTMMGESADANVRLAQQTVDQLPDDTSAWAFAYDGYLTISGDRSDAIFVEVGDDIRNQVRVYAQRYRKGSSEVPAERIGKVGFLARLEPRLRNSLSCRGRKAAQPGATDNPDDAQR